MFHLHIRYIAKHSGAPPLSVFEYISRTGKFAKKHDRVREVISLNMPAWSVDDGGLLYWKAAGSTASRVNARAGYLVEFAIPRMMTLPQQRALAVGYSKALALYSADETGVTGSVPLTLAIHEGLGRNPHAHLFLSSSIDDGIRRSASAWFMRHNPTHPTIGGARRSRKMAKTVWLRYARELWADMANRALVRCGLSPTLDHRSHAARGLLQEPGIHLGPSAAHLMRQDRPAPGIQNFTAIEKKNAEHAELLEQLDCSRRRLHELDAQKQVVAQELLDWQDQQRQLWQYALVDHPLNGNSRSIKSSATVVVHESDLSNAKSLHAAFDKGGFQQTIVAAVGPEWDCQIGPTGLWLVQPNRDQVVFVGRGYLATDTDDEAGIIATVAAAKVMQFSSPTVTARSDPIYRFVEICLIRLKLNWLTRMIGGNSVRPRPK